MTALLPQLLIAGAGLALLPVLLHLLNLQQRRPVRWAAMEFLLESQARNRTWINFKQWLLLAARVLAILLAAAMAARPQLTGGLAAWLPGEPVHHVVLLDDTYSMTDQAGSEASPWRRATAALEALARRASESRGHRVTVVRVSRADEPLSYAGEQLLSLRENAAAWQPSQSAGGLTEAITAAAEAAGNSRANERAVAYVLSDFRRHDLLDTEAATVALERLSDRVASLALAECVDRRRANLSIDELRLLPGATVAAVEMSASITVTNHSTTDAGRTAIRLWRDDAPLPAIEIESLAAGESVTRQFPLRYADPGAHRLRAELPADPVAADNHRYLALDLPAERPVLIVDGSDGHEGQAFATALRPRGGVATGWLPERRRPDELASVGDLSRFAAVLLLDAPRFDDRTVDGLRRYAEEQGGLLLVLGESIDRSHYNRRLLADATPPLLPIRLGVPTQTEADPSGRPTTLTVTDHPTLRVFAGDRTAFLDQIRVQLRHTLDPVSDAVGAADRVRVLASLGSGAPVLVESIDGRGRVIGLLTATARPASQLEGWSNLSVSPLFPILVNELVGYLAEQRVQPQTLLVGDALSSATNRVASASRLSRFEDEAYVALETKRASSNSTDDDDWGLAEQAGLYRTEGPAGNERSFAVNVDSVEGDLDFVNASALRRMFSEIDLTVIAAEQLAGKASPVGVALYQRLGVLLLVLLAVEQALAYAFSYHRVAPNTERAA